MSIDYQNLLNKKQWQDKSHRIKTRDNLKCQAFDCKTPDSILEVHHLYYLDYRDPWNYPDDMLITLCSTCHSKEKYRYKHEESLFMVLKMNGFLLCDIHAFTVLLHSDKRFTENLLSQIREIKNG